MPPKNWIPPEPGGYPESESILGATSIARKIWKKDDFWTTYDPHFALRQIGKVK